MRKGTVARAPAKLLPLSPGTSVPRSSPDLVARRFLGGDCHTLNSGRGIALGHLDDLRALLRLRSCGVFGFTLFVPQAAVARPLPAAGSRPPIASPCPMCANRCRDTPIRWWRCGESNSVLVRPYNKDRLSSAGFPPAAPRQCRQKSARSFSFYNLFFGMSEKSLHFIRVWLLYDDAREIG